MPDERLRFQEFGFQRLANGRCRAKVVLTWSDGRRFEGSCDGVTSQTGELRCCAVAAVNALEQAKHDLASLRLHDLDHGGRSWVPAAGVPIFIALFGRDTLTAACQ